MSKSPCVRNCCLNKEDICVGCFRHIDEIVGWNSLPEVEKKRISEQSEIRKSDAKLIVNFKLG